MSAANEAQLSSSVSGSAIVWQRPSKMVMVVKIRAAEATLDLGLAKLRKLIEAAGDWFGRFEVDEVIYGEPHFEPGPEADPVAQRTARAAAALGRSRSGAKPATNSKAVVATVSGVWDIDGKSAEELLVLVDRLRYEATQDTEPDEAPQDSPPEWGAAGIDPEQFINALNGPPEADDSPSFWFIAKLDEKAAFSALTEATNQARRHAEKLAQSLNMAVSRVTHIHNPGWADTDIRRPDRMLKQRLGYTDLIESGYPIGEDSILSADPRSVDFSVSVNMTVVLTELGKGG